MESTGTRQNANVSLEELLADKHKCPVCMEAIRDSPVFLCINGHELCHKCRDRQRKPGFLSLFSLSKPCPVCKCELTDVRARPLERILNELPQNANVSLEEYLADKLQCPVCMEAIRDSPVFLCTNGHQLCNTCRDRIKREEKPCPVCKGQLTNVRARALERILDELPKTVCSHEGCTFARSDTQVVKTHEEQECSLKPVTCETCQEAIALSQVYNHLVTIHEMIPLTPGDQETTWQTLWGQMKRSWFWDCLNIELPLFWTVNQMIFQSMECLDVPDSDFKFFLNILTYDTNLTMFWVSIGSSSLEAAGYTYKLKIKNPQEDDKYIFSGEQDCVSCEVSLEDMKKKGDALFLSKALFKKAAEENDGQSLKFSVTLKIEKK